MSTVGRVVAVFDLDGTITRRDTLFPYVWRYLARRPWRLVRLLAVAPALLTYLFAGRDRGRLKAALLRHTLRGETRATIDAWNAAYLPSVIARGLLPGAVAAVARERQRGATLVLMSASVDLYVPALGELLGFEHVVCTGVRWEDGVLDGTLATPNRRGEEKARCLERLRADLAPVASITAYANSSSDLPHMRLAERGVLVNGPRRARAEAATLGIECVDWRGT